MTTLSMSKTRLEAFSDGVLAIIITIMVLELKTPHGHTLADLRPLLPVFLSYVLSFVYVGIYWNNHHHMLHLMHGVNGGIMWANLHLLFWLSLIPFATSWVGEHPNTAAAVLYGVLLFLCGFAYSILRAVIIRSQGPGSELKRATGGDRKGIASVVIYLLGIGLSSIRYELAFVLYVGVALMWLVPDRRIEKGSVRV